MDMRSAKGKTFYGPTGITDDVDIISNRYTRARSLKNRSMSVGCISDSMQEVFENYVSMYEDTKPNIYRLVKPLYSPVPTPGSTSFMITEFKNKLNETMFRLRNFPKLPGRGLQQGLLQLFKKCVESRLITWSQFFCIAVQSWDNIESDIVVTFCTKELRDYVFRGLRRNLMRIRNSFNPNVDVCDELIGERARIFADARKTFKGKRVYILDGGVHITLSGTTAYRMVTWIQYTKFVQKYRTTLVNCVEEDETIVDYTLIVNEINHWE